MVSAKHGFHPTVAALQQGRQKRQNVVDQWLICLFPGAGAAGFEAGETAAAAEVRAAGTGTTGDGTAS